MGLRTWRWGLQLRPSRLRNEPAHRTGVKVEDDIRATCDGRKKSNLLIYVPLMFIVFSINAFGLDLVSSKDWDPS